ncbi:MAG: ribbon-helix-helix protein, CopG family [Vulcanisaeta sp.]|nr:ribbon-helix-helix protein, CopG family [Vulcanisaeta sp.]
MTIVPRQLRDELEKLARDRGVSLGELVRQAMVDSEGEPL